MGNLVLEKNEQLHKDIESVIDFCMSMRGSVRDMDELLDRAYKVDSLSSVPDDLIISVAISLEKALIKNYKPISALDFQKELEKMYGKLMGLVSKLDDVDVDLAFEDDYEAKKLTTFLRTITASKDFLKLILDSQEKFYKAQKMQEFMDDVIELVGKFEPAKKKHFIETINKKLTGE